MLRGNIKRSELKKVTPLLAIILVIGALLLFKKLNVVQAGWWPQNGSDWTQRKMLNVVNSSSGTVHTNTPIAITVDTKALYDAGKLQSDCDDLRVLYQPNDLTAIELARYIVYPSGETCTNSKTAKVYFPVQADLSAAASTSAYYIYYGNDAATAPSNTDNAFDIGASDAMLVCPFNGSTSCVAGEIPASDAGALRYSSITSGLNFDGVNDYVQVGSDGLGTSITTFTVSAWMKVISGSAYDGWGYAIHRGNSSAIGGSIYWLGVNISGNYGAAVSGDYTSSDTGILADLENWRLVTLTYDGATKKVYVDGELKVTNAIALTSTQTGNQIGIGGTPWNATYRNVMGNIDEVLILDRALSDADVLALYNSGAGRINVRDNYTKLLYHFDESGGTTAYDVSGNGNNGTINGAKYTNGYLNSQSFVSHEGMLIEEPTVNKIPNPSFEHGTFDTSWTSSSAGYTLQDEFTTARSAGAVNATNSENSAGTSTSKTRTLTDTNSTISISSGSLASGGNEVSSNDPRLYYMDVSGTRVPGKVLIGELNAESSVFFGYGSGSRPQYGAFNIGATSVSTHALSGNLNASIASVTTGTYYSYAFVQRASGGYYLIKGGTEFPSWTLLYHETSDSSADFPGLASFSSASNRVRRVLIPTTTWLPTPLAYDTFSSDGATSTEATGPDSQVTPSLSWTNGTKSGGTMSITPTLGAEVITNGGFDSDTSWTKGTGWSIGSSVATFNGSAWADINQAFTPPPSGTKYRLSFDLTRTAGNIEIWIGGVYQRLAPSSSGTYYLNKVSSGTTPLVLSINASPAFRGTVDNVSIKPLTTSTVISSVNTSTPNVVADVTISALTTGTQAGLVLNLDSTTSPANFIIIYHNGTSLIVDEAVNGVYTNKQTTTVALGAGALRVTRDGTKLRVYLNNALVGAELTMTANTNTKHGIFSTYASNTFDNFSLFARGTGGEYGAIPSEPQGSITTTENTDTKYLKYGTKSAKIVATGDGSVTTSITPSSTNTHTLSAYVYTTGAAVTSADAALVFNGDTVTTTYSDAGGGWWRLSYSAATAGTQKYGVAVYAGKTIYVDGVQLEEKTASTTYADGSLGTGYTWTGVAHNSTSARTPNKLTNPGFESSLGYDNGWSSYILNDEFTTDLASGSVNGTLAEPTGGVRTVTDNTNKISIGSGVLNFSGGLSSYSDPGIRYGSTTRSAGKLMVTQVTTDANFSKFGFKTNSGPNYNFQALSDSYITVAQGAVMSSNDIVLAIAPANAYYLATILRSTGSFTFIKGGAFTNWTLLWAGNRDSTTTLYPTIGNHSSTFTDDNVRIPASTWLPTPIAYDTFSSAGATSTETSGPDGQTTPSLSWTNGTKASGTMSISPTQGAEMATNSGMEGTYVAGIAPNWVTQGSGTLSEENGTKHGGASSQKIVSTGAAQGIKQNPPALTVGNWYTTEGYFYSTEALNSYLQLYDKSNIWGRNITTNAGSWTNLMTTFKASNTGGAGGYFRLLIDNGSGKTAYFDDTSVKPLTLSTLFSTVPTSDADVVVDTNVTMTSGTQAGLVLNLDSTSSPANFILVYHNGTQVLIDEVVAGTYTNKQTTTVTYVAGATLRAIRDGTKLRVYYNNALVGAELTMAANTNTTHGLFSTYSGNTFDNFTLFPRGTGGEYATLIDDTATFLTATENTNASYIYSGTKSTKLVSVSNNMQYVTTAYPNNTNTHTLSAYVYTNGSAVTAADAKLVFNGTAVTPTYTSAGGGWYRLTYSATGVNTSSTYGIEVQADKTIYVDDIQLEEKADATTYNNGTTPNLQYALTNNLSATAGSVSLWLKTPWAGNDSKDHTIFDVETASGALKLSKNASNNLVLTNGTSSATKAVTWTADTWVHITADWGSSNMHVYVNASAGTAAGAYAVPTFATKIYLGQDKTTNNYLNGYISDLRFYSTVLTSTQVSDIYYAGMISRAETSQTIQIDRFSSEKGQGPVSVWHMDEGYGTSANDSTTKLNHLTVNGATWETASKTSRSLKFDGSNDYLSRAYDSDFDFGTNTFTLTGMFKHSSTISGTDTILARQAGSTGYKVYMNSSGYLCFSVNADVACSTTSYADSSWHHFSAVRSATGITLYVDTNQVATTAQASPATVSGSNVLYVGIDSDGTSNPWDGFLDEVEVYSYARSVDQVKTDNLGGQVSARLGSRINDNLTSGLVGYWKLDETATPALDSSGNGNSGTWNGNTAAAAGKFGNAASFDGTGDYVALSTTPSASTNISTGTLSVWIKTSGVGAGIRGVVVKQNAYSIFLGGTGCADNTLTTYDWSINDGNPECSTSVSLADNSWHLVTIVFRSGITNGTEFYVDGQPAGKATITISNQGNGIVMGAGNNPGAYQFYTGSLDEVRVYNRALSPGEVRQLYEYAPGPIAHWNFDEGSGTSANDISGNGNTGTWEGTGSHHTAGKYGSAGRFASTTSDSVTITDNSGLDSKNMTTEVWVFPTNIGSSGGASIYNRRTAGNVGGFTMDYQDNRTINCYYYISGSWSNSTSTALTLNRWNHVTCSYDGSIIRTYIDGILSGTPTSVTGTINNPTSPSVKIGKNITSSLYFPGSIDDLKIYNYARTQKQILEDMNGNRPANKSPVAYYKFDEGQGTVANNSGIGGAALNGTLTNISSPATATSGWTSDGKINKALTFDGSNDYTTTNYKPTTAEGSICMWLKPTYAAGTRPEYYYASAESGNTNFITLSNWSNGNSYWGWYVGGIEKRIITNKAFPSGWFHACFTWNTATGISTLYWNGSEVGTSSGLTSLFTMNYSPYIGAINRVGVTASHYAGQLDDLKVFTYALTKDEVGVEYNQGAQTVLTKQNSTLSEYCVPGSTDPCTAPIAEWKFDENTSTSVKDSSGNENTGTLTNGPVWTSGKYSSGIKFDGTNDYISIPDNAILDFGTGVKSMSISLWAKINTAGLNQTLVSKRETDASPNTDYIVFTDSGNLYWGTGTSADSCAWMTTPEPSANTWHHILTTITQTGATSGTKQIFIDGILKNSCSYTNKAASTTTSLYIGKYNGSGSYFGGIIDQVQIYNYTRTPAQVAWDYNKGGPVAWYKFDECTGTTAYDASGNSSNGTISIGATGTNTSAGTCTGSAGEAWKDGASGKLNSSLEFDGTDDVVSIPTSNALDSATGASQPRSVGMWVKYANSTSEVIMEKGAGNHFYFLTGATGDAGKVLWSCKGGSGNDVASDTVLNDNLWHHILGVFDGTTLKMYVDGKLQNETNAIGATCPVDDSSALTIGGRDTTYSHTGQIDEVRIFNYALTPTQVKTLHNENSAVRM